MASLLARTLKKLQSGRHNVDTGPPPDGGARAWLMVLLAHLAVFTSFGYINSFGIFQQYYESTQSISPSAISWIGSLQVFLAYFGGIFSGRAVDAGYFHLTIGVGFTCQVVAAFTTSAAAKYWQLFLAQGLLQGIGNGLLFCSVVTLISTYFSKRRALAMACIACGGATGGLVFPAIAQNLLFKIGFGWTVRIMAFIMLLNGIVVVVFSRTRLPHKANPGPLIEWGALAEPAYALFALGVFFALWGIFYTFYYVRPFARNVLGADEHTSFSILLLINGMGIPGRLLPALLTAHPKASPTVALDLLIPVTALGSVLLFCWIAVTDLTGLWVFVVLFGLPGSAVQSLYPAAVGAVSGGGVPAGARIGLVFAIASPACLSGPPIAGALIESRGGSYLGAQLFGGCVMAIGAVLFGASRWCLGRKIKTWRGTLRVQQRPVKTEVQI